MVDNQPLPSKLWIELVFFFFCWDKWGFELDVLTIYRWLLLVHIDSRKFI